MERALTAARTTASAAATARVIIGRPLPPREALLIRRPVPRTSSHLFGRRRFSRGGKRALPPLPTTTLALLPLLLPLLALLASTARGAGLPGPNDHLSLHDVRSGGCVPTTITFEPINEAAAALVAAQTNPTALLQTRGANTVVLPHLTAVDDCGNELPIALETTGFDMSAENTLAPGGTLDLLAVLPCGGTKSVAYVAELPNGELLAVKDFTFEVEC